MKSRSSKLAKVCNISRKVKEIVYNRDGGVCIVCGSNQGIPNAHFISRAHQGKGIEQNIVTLCPKCHHLYDNSKYRKEYYERIKAYLLKCYPDLDIESLRYKNKWE